MTQQEQQQHLADCLQLSKTSLGRLQLLRTGEFKRLCNAAAVLLPAWDPSTTQPHRQGVVADAQFLLLLLRVLRNNCAAGTAAAEALQASSLHLHAAHLAAAVAQAQVQSPAVDQQQRKQQQQLLLAALQLLANMCAASAHSAAAVWAVLYPDRLRRILAVLQVDVHEAAALVMLYCVRASSHALADVTSQAASSIWLHLLAPVTASSCSATASSSSTSVSDGSAEQHQQQQHPGKEATAAMAAAGSTGQDTAGNDNLCLLVKAVALQNDCLQQVMQCLQVNTEATGDSTAAFNAASTGSSQQAAAALPGFRTNLVHAVLLHIVELEVGTIPEASNTNSRQAEQAQQQQQSLGWLAFLVDLLRQLPGQVSISATSHNTVAARVLEATLQVLKAVLGREDAGRGLLEYAAASAVSSSSGHADCVTQLHSLGLVQLVLHMLQQLGPPPKLRQQEQQQQLQQQAAVQSQLQPQPHQQQQQPYAGYRADLIALLSNMLYGRRPIQDELLAAGGVEVLLNNCNLDDSAPLAREWALWSIRNMCRDNAAVQQYITKFQAVEAVQSAELERMGKELQLDRAINKLHLVDKPKQWQQQQEQRRWC